MAWRTFSFTHAYIFFTYQYLFTKLTVLWTSSCEVLVKYDSYKSQQYFKICRAMYDGTLVKSKIHFIISALAQYPSKCKRARNQIKTAMVM